MITDKKFAMERSNSMMSSRSIDNEEMMVIEINFDIGGVTAAAQAFVKKHKLKEKAVPTIANHIIDTVEAHLQAAGGMSPTAEALERGRSPLDPAVKVFSPNSQSVKNVFRGDAAKRQSSDSVPDLSFGVSPIPRETFRQSFEGADPISVTDASCPIRQTSEDDDLLGSSRNSRSHTPHTTVGMGSPRLLSDAGSEGSGHMQSPRGGHRPGYGSMYRSSGSFDNQARNISPDRASNASNGISTPGADSEANYYNNMKNSWKIGDAKKAQQQLTKRLEGSKMTGGLIVSTASSKKKVQRSAVFSGHATDSSFKRITANERLYHGASVRTQRKEAKINESIVLEEQVLARGRESIKVKGKSKEIVATLSQRDADIDITQRLYDEAASIRDTKDKAVKREMLKPKKEQWSCPLCCSYHEPAKSHIYSGNQVKHCKSCGWEGVTEDLPFNPVAVDLQYDLSGVNRSEMIRNSYKRRGIENFPTDKTNGFDVYEYLYKDNLHQKEKVLLMQNKWNEEESKLTFKPEIPAESLHLLSRRLTDPADSGTSSGQRVVQDTHDRLHNTTITCKSEVLLITQNTPNKLSDPAEHDKFIDRLTYEYEIKAKRQEELKKLFLETDIKTGKPLFKPTIPGSSLTHVLHLSEEESAWTDATTNGAEARKEKIHEKLLRRGEEHRERMQILQEHFLAKEKEEMEAQSRHALPESTRILQESSENSIGEIFKVLLTCQMHNEAKNSPETSDALKRAKGLDPEVLLKISMELSNWREGVLNIAEADPELMIESVQSLLTEVIELSKSKNCNSKYPNVYRQYDKPVLLDLELFSEHIWSCIKKREGGGKSYLFLPRREVSPKKEEKPPPFRPEIDEKSRKMVLSSRNNAVPVEDILLNRYEESQLRFEDIKRDIDKERYAECTFQPHFYKPGNGIKPRPKYQSSVQEISSKIQPPEPSRIIANSDSKTQQSKKRGIIVSVTRVATGNNSVGKGKASVESWEDAEAGVKQLYDIDNESLENSNDSITVPRQSIMSAVSLESSPNASSDQILSSMRERHSNSSGGVSIYSPPWIKKT